MGTMRLIVLLVLLSLVLIVAPKLTETVFAWLKDGKRSGVEAVVDTNNAVDKVSMTPGEWKRVLVPELYRVARRGGTEAPFSGKYNEFSDDGLYYCFVCGNELFDSDAKFPTKSGWPAFDSPVTAGCIAVAEDNQDGIVRSNIKCSKCDSHLGFLYIDGPKERTGLRYSVNSISLRFIPRF